MYTNFKCHAFINQTSPSKSLCIIINKLDFNVLHSGHKTSLYFTAVLDFDKLRFEILMN